MWMPADKKLCKRDNKSVIWTEIYPANKNLWKLYRTGKRHW